MRRSGIYGKFQKVTSAVLLTGSLLGLAGCSHKLIGRAGETSVNVYSSKKDFENVMSMKSQGGAEGIIGGVGEAFMARKIAENTPVKILSSDSEGDDIQVLQGPNAGLRGYVAKDNID